MSVREKELQKIRGEAAFTNDIHPDDIVYGHIIRSTQKEGLVKEILPPALPENYFLITSKDIPGDKFLSIGLNKMPYLGDENISYTGEPICLIAGPNKKNCEALAEKTRIEYQRNKEKKSNKDPENQSLESSIELNPQANAPKKIKKNSIIYSGQLRSRKSLMMEPTTVVSLWNNKNLILYAPVQNPYILKPLLASALKIPKNRIKIIIPFICDPFNQKLPTVLRISILCALASKMSMKACKISIQNNEDLLYIPSPPNFYYKFKAYKNDDEKLSGLDIHLDFNIGAYNLFASDCNIYTSQAVKGLYNLESQSLSISLNQKPEPPAHLNRGYCEPYVHFAIESFWNHYSMDAGQNPLNTRLDKLSSSKQSRKKNALPPAGDFLLRACKLADFSRKWASYQVLGQKNSYSTIPAKRRGIGLAFCPHYIYPCREYENQSYKITCSMDKNKKLRIQSSLIDLNQNRSYTLSVAASRILNLHLSDVIFEAPDLENIRKIEPIDHIRTMTLVKLVEDACEEIKRKLKRLKPPISVVKRINLPKYSEQYIISNQPESLEATIIEVEIDPIDLHPVIRGAWVYYYIGCRENEEKIRPQIQSALNYNLCQIYQIPRTKAYVYGSVLPIDFAYINSRNQAPTQINFDLTGDEDDRPRCLGHLAVTGAAPAFKAAVEQALNLKITKAPFSPQELYKELQSHGD